MSAPADVTTILFESVLLVVGVACFVAPVFATGVLCWFARRPTPFVPPRRVIVALRIYGVVVTTSMLIWLIGSLRALA